ncbi:hypothetical protein LC76P1_00223 [Lysinibacillus phage LC76P1]|nr:hypothetical protein LC76P1_00223 [Lysinibacillus phage LC76P1]
MAKKLYYRFEMYENGEPLGVGIFQGLRRVIDWELDRSLTINMDRLLPIPPVRDIKWEHDCDTISYFTKDGKDKFIGDLQKIAYIVRNQRGNFEVRQTIIALDENDSRILYSDDYQVLLIRETEKVF